MRNKRTNIMVRGMCETEHLSKRSQAEMASVAKRSNLTLALIETDLQRNIVYERALRLSLFFNPYMTSLRQLIWGHGKSRKRGIA